MSKYAQINTTLREETHLIETLRELGYHPEVHPQGAKLSRYYSEQEEKTAHVIVRRHELPGSFGDVGFVKQADGRFQMIADELDERYQSRAGASWLGHVQQVYKERQTLAIARTKGYVLKTREVVKTSSGEQVRLQFIVRR